MGNKTEEIDKFMGMPETLETDREVLIRHLDEDGKAEQCGRCGSEDTHILVDSDREECPDLTWWCSKCDAVDDID